jgi:hypothetical protein
MHSLQLLIHRAIAAMLPRLYLHQNQQRIIVYHVADKSQFFDWQSAVVADALQAWQQSVDHVGFLEVAEAFAVFVV